MKQKKTEKPPPDYSTEELQELSEILNEQNTTPSLKLRTIIHNSSYTGFLLKDILKSFFPEEYKLLYTDEIYKGNQENSTVEAVRNWKLSHNK